MPNEIDVKDLRELYAIATEPYTDEDSLEDVMVKHRKRGEAYGLLAGKLVAALPALLDELERLQDSAAIRLASMEILARQRDEQRASVDEYEDRLDFMIKRAQAAEAERDALKAKLEKVREWSIYLIGAPSKYAALNAILDGKEG